MKSKRGLFITVEQFSRLLKIYNQILLNFPKHFIVLGCFFVSFLSNNPISAIEQIKLSKQEQIWIDQHHVVRVRVGKSPPLHFFDGEFQGISVDYLNFIAKQVGFQIQYLTDIPWPDSLAYIKNHEVIDLILSAKITPERKKFIAFTKEYLLMPYVIFSRNDNYAISAIENLFNQTVSIEQGYTLKSKLIKEYPEIKLLEKETTKDAIQALSRGEVNAYIGNMTVATYIIQTYNLSNIKIAAPTPFDHHNQAMAIRNDWPELASIINKSLDTMLPKDHKVIRNKWLAVHDEYGIQKVEVLKCVLVVVLISGVLLTFILFWNSRLQKEINEREKVEKQLKISLKEKETLLHEIHHRVKNNMNVISSLLKLQTINIKDPQTREVLKESQNRIYAMSIVHEILHGSENISQIDLKTYLSKIATAVFQTYTVYPNQIELLNNVEKISIGINQASPLGLIVTELISNSLKYAFPNDRKGQITVRMNKSNQMLQLTIKDDGIGIPDTEVWKNSNTLGLKLVRTLVENQLDGTIDLKNKNGAKFVIKFKIKNS